MPRSRRSPRRARLQDILIEKRNAAGLTQVALSDAAWLIFDEAMVKGAVLQMAADPGPLINGNTLCGGPDMPARWLVLAASPGSDATLQLAAFSGDDPPASIQSDALCGTYNYGAE